MQWSLRQLWDGANEDQATQYGIAVRGAWPVMIQWRGNDSAGKLGEVFSTLHCIQADEVVAGNEIPSPARKTSVCGTKVMVISVVAIMLLCNFL